MATLRISPKKIPNLNGALKSAHEITKASANTEVAVPNGGSYSAAYIDTSAAIPTEGTTAVRVTGGLGLSWGVPVYEFLKEIPWIKPTLKPAVTLIDP
jgi:hypothetical protein